MAACSNAPQVLEIQAVPTNDIPLPEAKPPVPNPDPVDQLEISWVVLTPDTVPEGTDWVFFGLTPQQYEILAANQADLLRFIEEAFWRLQYYRDELPVTE